MYSNWSIKLSKTDFAFYAIVLLIFLTFFPITMCLPSLIRYALQIFSIAMFFFGLIITRNYKLSFLYIMTSIVMLVRVYMIWQFKKSFASCAFSVFAAWAFAFYGLTLYKESKTDKSRRLLLFLLILLSLTAITTIIGIRKYPLVVRELGRGTTSYSGQQGTDFSLAKWEYRLANIAGWNQLYGMVFIVPVFLYAYFRSKKTIYLLGAAILEVCIILSQLTFAMLLSFALSVLCLIKIGRAHV